MYVHCNHCIGIIHMGIVEKKSHSTGLFKQYQAVLQYDYSTLTYMFMLYNNSVRCVYGEVPLQLRLFIHIIPNNITTNTNTNIITNTNTMISAITDPAPVKQGKCYQFTYSIYMSVYIHIYKLGKEFAITYSSVATVPDSSSSIIRVTVLRCAESSHRLLWTNCITHILTKL